MDSELKSYLEKMNANLDSLNQKREGLGRSFLKGVLSGIGSVVGVALALILLGWFLNTVGVIPAFQDTAREWKQTLDEIKRVR